MSVRYDAGVSTAYGAAVAGGYTGTYEEFCAALGALANVLEDLENFTVEITTLPAGEQATASYADGVLSLGIPKGDKGDTGATGNGIASITKTGTSGLVDTYTILYTDGTSTTFTVTNGEKGDKGNKGDTGATGNGIASITLTSTSGAVKTYTILYTDGTSTTFEVTDGEVTNAVLEETIENFAEGVHENMTSGNAEALLSGVYTENSEPYLFRKTGGSHKVGSREYLDKIVGGSLVVNQLVKQTDYEASKTVSGITFTNNGDGTVTADGTATATVTFELGAIPTSFFKVGHRYLSVSGFSSDGSASTYEFQVLHAYAQGQNWDVYRTAQITNVSIENTITKQARFVVRSGATVSNLKLIPQIIDLTSAFGSIIAEYVYNLEQDTAGAGIAWLRQYIDIDSYHPYSEPTLKHVEGLASHDTVGFNQFNVNGLSATDFMYQLGGNYYSGLGSSGTFSVSDDQLTINRGNADLAIFFCIGRCFKGVAMCVSLDCANGYIADIDLRTEPPTSAPDNSKRFYRKTFTTGTTRVQDTFTPDQDGYVYIELYKAGGGNLTETISHLNYNYSLDGKRDGEYEPYQKRSYPLESSVVLRGYPMLVDGRLKFDGDEYLYNGTINRNYNIVDMGTLNWIRNTGNQFYADLPTNMDAVSQTTKAIVSNEYRVTISAAYNNTEDKVLSLRTARVWVVDSDYSTASAFKAAMNGVYLVYLLNAPTTETAEPFRQLQICDTYGTEEFVTTSEVPVGTETRYPEDLKAKVEGLPWDLSMIAPIENGTTASQAYTAGQYFLHNNVFCKAKTNIASGATFTLNTNYEETTVAAELYAALH